VAIASRGEDKLKAACEELKAQTGREFKYYVCDATIEASVEACAKRPTRTSAHRHPSQLPGNK
jgi:short-subunit dehydrogenase